MSLIDLARSRAAYARLRAPDWPPHRLVVPMSVHGHAMVENAAAALRAYRTANRAVRIALVDGTEHVGWVEDLHVVRDPDPNGEALSGAVFLTLAGGGALAIDLAQVRAIGDCASLDDWI